MPVTLLRDVRPSDLDAFFEHQSDPEAAAMAVFPPRDREAFDAHWQRLLADHSLVTQTIVADGAVAGNIGCWTQDGLRLVGYWIGRDFWGRGVATTALAELAAEIPDWLKRIRAWGYPDVRARQLAHNRQEICVAAFRPPRRISKPGGKRAALRQG